jgi:putative ABC transport system substrate-binding protein
VTTRRNALFALALLCGAVRANAQRPLTTVQRRIALIYGGFETDTEDFEKAFFAAMSRLGWARDSNIVVERAFANGDENRLAKLPADLNQKRVELIVALGNSAPTVAARATRTIPVVFVGTYWPLERGLIDSYARPGRNVTGIAGSTDIEAHTKRLDFLRQIVPSATKLSWTSSPSFLSFKTVDGRDYRMVPVFDAAAKERGFDSRFHEVTDWQNLDLLFQEITASSAQALMSVGAIPQRAVRSYIALATRYHLPTAFFWREYAQAGGLFSYGTPDLDSESHAMRSAEYVDRILRGAKPDDMPVIRPDKYELVINVKTASALGVTIPQSLLARANEVIQ